MNIIIGAGIIVVVGGLFWALRPAKRGGSGRTGSGRRPGGSGSGDTRV